MAEARASLYRSYDLLDAHLAGSDWIAGPTFTLADAAAAPSLFYAGLVHRWDKLRLAHLRRYFEALLQRPSVARVVAEARPYRELFPLPWPDDSG